MIYDLSNKIEIEKINLKLEYLIKKGCKVEFTEKRPTRTLKQNNYLHLLLSFFGCEVGYTLEEVKQFFKILNEDYLMYEKDGNKYFKSTAQLDTKQMTICIDRFKSFALEQGIYLPDAENVEGIEYAQNTIEKNTNFL